MEQMRCLHFLGVSVLKMEHFSIFNVKNGTIEKGLFQRYSNVCARFNFQTLSDPCSRFFSLSQACGEDISEGWIFKFIDSSWFE